LGKLAALFALTLTFGGVRLAGASCAGPEVDFGPRSARPGDRIVVSGRFWDNICDDTGGSGPCGQEDGFDSEPTQDIQLLLRPLGFEGSPIELGKVDADDDVRFKVHLMLPEGLRPGRYRLLANRSRASEPLIVSKR
jgi:hypothetical protein